ncbi:SpoIID/LytB domain-containing protein [Paenibacillus psychroresistens]|uniref:SpoIID/LytB domain-containing protein n=1 Tax=Paenibacillus psychroresistens TaxID=1778678 RepID=A0A6B8RHM7_9BACL|nr:SpoIID/LytB domain-containing protein [Paenibacillus psychroresistens]QGQ95417.1 SpoIID/LytB domain-containing protein [Paenibacillus psychroresistens]
MTESNLISNSIQRSLILLIIFLMAAGGLLSNQGHAFAAAVPKLDNIRVALLIDTPSYKVNAPSVTLSSTSGLKIGIRTATGIQSWLGGAALKSARGTVDQFMVQVLETSDASLATALKQKLSEASYVPYLFQKSKLGKALIQVWTGPYGTKEAATIAKEAINNNKAIMALAVAPKVTGNMHWSAGSYSTVNEAVYSQTNLSQAGIIADLVYQADAAGSVSYAVWVGNEIDQAALDSLKQKAAELAPTVALKPVDSNAPYILKRDDITTTTSGQAPVAHYFFNAINQKVWVTAEAQGKITIKEKTNHSYRGSMELSLYNGKMALINELPFEQYLYGVVGSEMATGWPKEALKAQAVAARTYALIKGNAYKIANISDSTTDQVYTGIEYADVIQAIDETKGEVLVDSKGLITPFYSANAGGVTSDPSEVWGSSDGYLKSFPSAGDNSSQSDTIWYRVALASGITGYVHSAYLKDTGIDNEAGLAIYEATEAAVNVRAIASSRDNISSSIGQINKGEQVTIIGQTLQSGSYIWQRGPVNAASLATVINQQVPGTTFSGPLQSLQVASRGPSGRVTLIQANGQDVKVTRPDSYRTVLGGLPSTLFDIEETGSYTVLGANGVTTTYPQGSESAGLYVIQANANAQAASKQWFILSTAQQIRVVTSTPQFMFTGKGFGHGLGMSQDGAFGFAQQGYDYKKILNSYFAGIDIVKG